MVQAGTQSPVASPMLCSAAVLLLAETLKKLLPFIPKTLP
jgi:hypothetical protein